MSTNEEYWSNTPFISYDGFDESGYRAEVKVALGFGKIISLTDSDSGKAMQVKIDNGHPKWNSSGWVPTSDPIAADVKKAYDEGTPIYFRIETKRKPKVDRKRPINELSKEDANGLTGKAFVGIKFNEDDDWNLSPLAVTRLDEDPHSGTVSANSDKYQSMNNTATPTAASSTPRGNSIDTPWFVKFPDGTMNPGSQAAGVPLNIYSFMIKYFKDNGTLKSSTELSKSENAAQDKNLLLATKAVLEVCNEIQVTVYNGKIETPDLGAASHTAARKIIFMLLEKDFPVTPETFNDDEKFEKWHSGITDKAVKMWRWSMKEVEATIIENV